MATHGAEREAQRRADYLRSEVISQGERLREVEAQLAAVRSRLDAVEADLFGRGAQVDRRFGIWPRC